MRQPLIGVTADLTDNMINLRRQYVESVHRAGGLAVVLPVAASDADLAQLATHLDGLLFMGGADIDPACYGEARHPACGAAKPERDRTELFLMRLAREKHLPVLAICRGCQVMNVACGGTLVQDIETELGLPAARHSQVEDYAVTTHQVTVVPGSLLATVTGQAVLDVNTKHHQCVKTLGEGLVIDGRSAEDGLIEAFHDPKERFFLGVQWHPEMLSHLKSDAAALFSALVAAAREDA